MKMSILSGLNGTSPWASVIHKQNVTGLKVWFTRITKHFLPPAVSSHAASFGLICPGFKISASTQYICGPHSI